MPFFIKPVLDTMIQLSQINDKQERFTAYLALLQDSNTGDMKLPIDLYNPMAGSHILDHLLQLKAIDAEQIMREAINTINDSIEIESGVQVVLNIADDIGGAWTNRSTTDYVSKFRTRAKRIRGFCTPLIWASELVVPELIIQRLRSYAYRTLYQIKYGDPLKLSDHVAQEVYVNSKENHTNSTIGKDCVEIMNDFYNKYNATDDYNIIFNFFYGDKASKAMGYATFGNIQSDGFEYCSYLTSNSKLK